MEVPESTQKHTHVRLKQIEQALLRRKFCFLRRYVRIFGPGYGTASDYKGRIGPFVGIGLPLGYTKVVSSTYEPQHKMTCAPSEDSDQPGHPPSLIRVFAVRTMGN